MCCNDRILPLAPIGVRYGEGVGMLCPGWIYFCGARGQLILFGFIVSGRFWQTEWGNGEFELSKAGDFPDGGIGRGWGGSWSGLGNFWFGFIGVGGDWGGHWSGWSCRITVVCPQTPTNLASAVAEALGAAEEYVRTKSGPVVGKVPRSGDVMQGLYFGL